MLDLSALDTSIDTPVAGKPLELDLSSISEDENQPRSEFSEKEMQEMIASVKIEGVIFPISVRHHPEEPGKWIVVAGARRTRAARAAGLQTIPAFIDERAVNATAIKYRQVIENLQRDNLKPFELAKFISERKGLGESNSSIAKQLGKDPSFVTHHLALIDSPDCILDAYESGKCTSAKTLYELRNLYDKFPSEVSEWYLSTESVDRASVASLSALLKNKADSSVKTAAETQSDKPRATVKPYEHKVENVAESDESDTSPADTEMVSELENQDTDSTPPHSQTRQKNDVFYKPYKKIKKPVLLVEHKGRPANILLDRLPTSRLTMFIEYSDGTDDVQEVATKDIEFLALIEGNLK